MKILIIGAGTVGQALGALITKGLHEVYYHDFHCERWDDKVYDVIHYTVPMKHVVSWAVTLNTFVRDSFQCKYLIIESSIDPNGLSILEDLRSKDKQPNPPITIYSPIRATEAIMPKQLKALKKYWAFLHAPPANEQLPLLNYLHSIYPQGTVRFHDAKALAFGKMLEVVDFGLQIMFAQQVKLACDELSCHFEEAYTEYRKHSAYGADYNKLKKGAPMKWIPRGIFRPDVIKGKCVIQDAELLQQAGIMESLMNDLIGGNAAFGLKRIITEHKDEIREKLWGTKPKETHTQ